MWWGRRRREQVDAVLIGWLEWEALRRPRAVEVCMREVIALMRVRLLLLHRLAPMTCACCKKVVVLLLLLLMMRPCSRRWLSHPVMSRPLLYRGSGVRM